MSTGIEVVGMVVALYQLINASAGLISEFKEVCDGEPTANGHLEEHAKNLAQACALTQARYETMNSSDKLSDGEKRVQNTAEKCQASAQALLGELRYVRKRPESNNCVGAVAYVVKSKVHRKKIERMDARFKNDQQELQIILQSEILSQNKAMQYLEKEEFENWEADIQILINQVFEGFFGLQGFIEAQHKATNKIISRLDATDNLIVHGVAEVKQGIKEHSTTAQRKEFLDSFRYPEINMWYKDVLDSSEANFDRVFASYEKVTKYDQKSVLSKGDSNQFSSEASEYSASNSGFLNIESDELMTIDKSWSSFINWLRSSDSLFCIQGKPGSGESTLINLLCQVLETKSHAICVFVDGLDEVANDDGLDRLTREIEEILQFPGIKICVSSRPEASVLKWLERLHTPSILLENLTRPDMSSYVHKGLDPLLSSKNLSIETHQYLCDEMVRKSQGIFLWLSLVLRSLIDGVQNGDTEQILMTRLAELPSKIHDLYADIWERLKERSPVYRRDAVRFVLYILTNGGRAAYFRRQECPMKRHFYVKQPVLGQIAFAEMLDRHEALLKYGEMIDFKELQEICDMVRNQIEIRGGGLLQVRILEEGERIPPHDPNDLLMQQVAFIHRTAPRLLYRDRGGKINLAGRSCSQ
ncbi:hypothetical protein FPHYL_1980 [Fusarium phyllophilum]|uniref:NACHT domain-containing protein n=1 Tax=Fusarium phyllophilum TaxID=47803 RepID=A0A8H5NK62_9HYPO|nr:hypothetical protein FPHYL_1980 [Fusarium phyllophilum]